MEKIKTNMEIEPSLTPNKESPNDQRRNHWIAYILLVGILMVGGYFRLVGMNWGENSHMHPDERFMTMVASSVSSVSSFSEYFNTDISNLNPNNRGYSFYVYGTLPLFMVRYVAEALSLADYDHITLVGRSLSAVMDLITLVLVFFISIRLYKKTSIGLLASAFSAGAVLQIQLSHYFTVDSFANTFVYLALYCAVWIMTEVPHPIVNFVNEESTQLDLEIIPITTPEPSKSRQWKWLFGSLKELGVYILFGVAVGMALASKASTYPVIFLLPAAVLIRYWRTGTEEHEHELGLLIRNVIIAGLFAFLAFRVMQPYAFTGPGFLGIKPNPAWVQTMKEQQAQTTGDVDFPPALQWARRPVTFAWENMVLWGLGIPLGILAWVGFFWMVWYMFKRKEWPTHLLLWLWVGVYSMWQGLVPNRTMRYQIPVYPALAIIAAWAVVTLWEKKREKGINWYRWAAAVIGAVVLISTWSWAFAFTRIYTRPLTRVAASDWIYQNIPAAINLKIKSNGETFQQPLPFRMGTTISSEDPVTLAFHPRFDQVVSGVSFSNVISSQLDDSQKILKARISNDPQGNSIIAEGVLSDTFKGEGDQRGQSYQLRFDQSTSLDLKRKYYLNLSTDKGGQPLQISGEMGLTYDTSAGELEQSLPDPVDVLQPGKAAYTLPFTASRDGTLDQVYLPHVVDWQADPGEKIIKLSIYDAASSDQPLTTATLHNSFASSTAPRGDGYTFDIPAPVELKSHQPYVLKLEVVDGPGKIALYGSKQAVESSWDDALPLGRDGYDPFDYTSGLYRGETNLEMYWDDNVDKFKRFITILDQSDYIFISSNRQWGTTARVPERYPLTAAFYRNLLGCPQDKDIIWCYRVAQPGNFKGNLGYDLIYINQSDPNLGPFRFNTQFAEEAFTVYDHPKVMIFKKNADYSTTEVLKSLGSVDLTKVERLTPGKVPGAPADLMLPLTMLTKQQQNGTWSELFDLNALQNRYPFLGLLFWYLAVTLLGWVVYPFIRFSLGGLQDRGYPLVRMAGMLLLSYIVWLGSSLGISFTRLWISTAFLILIIINFGLYWIQRKSIHAELRRNWRYFLTVEILALVTFTFFLLIRLGNPDLWHPAKGGEKPMDFSYLNAVIKSTVFPPYDPWFGGGYLNYYYYGFVIVGVLIKWLGIIPSIAYNLFLPTFYSVLALGAFTIGWNLLYRERDSAQENLPQDTDKFLPGTIWGLDRVPFIGGLLSIVLLQIAGNLGTLRMIWHGIMRLAVSPEQIGDSNIIQRVWWTVLGFFSFLKGGSLPYGIGDWYWIPSRVFPNEPITEFPFFTFLYADPHAHLYALPITLLALAWALSIVKGKWDWSENGSKWTWLQYVCSFVLGGLTIGALRPTNTWDMPTYLVLGIVAVIYTVLRYGFINNQQSDKQKLGHRFGIALGSVVFLLALSFLLYLPYAYWNQLGYNSIKLWDGDHSPFWSYITHWGLPFFGILSWMIWETRDWMAETPLSRLKKLRKCLPLIAGLFISLVVIVVVLMVMGIQIAWLALPMAAWAGVLLLRPSQSDSKRAVLFMIGSGLVLTLAVELVVLVGDIGRMNTVFKFYLQAWTLFSLAAAAAFIWMFEVVSTEWSPSWRSGWQVAFGVLLGAVLLYPILAGTDKIRDRMSNNAPHTLDGLAYMATSTYSDQGVDMELNQDYQAIRWMQDNIKGSPVIVEANTPEYRWGSRFTINTGLPGVVGWNWHQRQQRGVVSDQWVTDRVDEVGKFYNSVDQQETINFLQKYGVKYIILGQLERAYYPGLGLEKFNNWKDNLWKEIYSQGDTTIYQVLPQK